MKKKNIAVVIVGSSHRDPAPIRMLKKYLMLFTRANIPVVSCSEIPCDQSLQDKQTLDGFNIRYIRKILEQNPVSRLLTKDKDRAKPFFPLDQFENIAIALKPILASMLHNHISDAQLKIITQQVMNYLAMEATMEFDQWLKENNIPFQGLERATAQNRQNNLRFWENSTHFLNSESVRINHMTDKICAEALAKLKGIDGVIFCQVGIVHTQRLAASLIDRFATQTECNVKVVPMCCYSNYSTDSLEQNLEIIRIQQGLDSDSLREAYKTFATPLVKIEENVQKYEFSSDGFDQMMNIALQHLMPQKSLIPQKLRDETPAFLIAHDIGVARPIRCCPTCNLL